MSRLDAPPTPPEKVTAWLLIFAACIGAWLLIVVGLLGIVGLLPERFGTHVLQAVLVVGAGLLVRRCWLDWRAER